MRNNILFIKSLLGSEVVFSSVVKGNAYGHGISNYCPLAFSAGIRHFSVFSAQEAFFVYQALEGKDFQLMIMGDVEDGALEWVIEKKIELYVFDQSRLEAAIGVCKKLRLKARIHIEIETGMNRTGFPAKDLAAVFQILKANQAHIEVKGLCSHFAGAESITNYKRIKDQFNRFKKTERTVDDFDWMTPVKHLASSSAAIRYPNSQMDLVRIGILQYGFFPTQEILVHHLTKRKGNLDGLQRVLSWKTRVMDIKDVKAGEFIGYGTSYFTNRQTKLALLPIGYSSGYSRSLGNQGKVLIKGVRYDVIGTVSMSMLTVDITSSQGIERGDEVVLIGHQGSSEISVASFSDYSNLINYELLTRLPQDIPRIIVE